jgi:tape measure domain-containing protein
MAGKSLGTLTLDLIARVGGFTQGMDKAERSAQKSMRGVKRSTDEASNGIAALTKRIAGPLAAALTVGKITQYADEWTNLNNRLKLVTDSTDQLQFAQNSVFDIAQRTRQSLGATAELYQRIASNADTLNLSLGDVNGVVETISKTLVISGASSQAASAALVQLGQAFASGTLRGEELNSVMEQAPALAKAIAEGLGVTIGELRALGKEGELTADKVIAALQKQAAAVDESFGKTTGTVGQAFEKLNNSIGRAIGLFNEATGASAAFSRVISKTADGIDALATGDQTYKLKQQIDVLKQALQGYGSADVPQARKLREEIAALEQQMRNVVNLRDMYNKEPLRTGGDLAFTAPDLSAVKESADEGLKSLGKLIDASDRFHQKARDAAEAEAQAIRDRYQNLEADFQRQITLYDDTSEAARIRYETERGELIKLEPYQKARLEALATEIDMLDQAKAAQERLNDEIAKSLPDSIEDYNDEQGKKLTEEFGAQMNQMSVFADQAARNMQDAFADFLFDPFDQGLDGMLKSFGLILQRMVAEAAAAQLFEAVFGKTGANGQRSGGVDWASLATAFAGMFDSGGSIPSGQWGIAGERGPEIVRGPAMITSRTDTAKMMRGGASISIGNMNFPNVRNEQEARRSAGAAAREITRIVSGSARYA